MNKKIWSLISLLLVGMLLLAACAPAATPTPEATEEPTQPVVTEEPTPVPEEPTPEPVEPTEVPMTELVVWADELRAPIIESLGNEFAQEFGITLTVQQLGFGDIRDQLAIAGPAGEGPDIIIGAHDWLGQLTANGLVAPIDMGGRESEFLEAALTAFTYDGELYGVPYATENIAFFCNPDIVETPPATWADVTALAETLEAESGGAVTAWSIQTNDPYHSFPLFTANGGYVFGLTEEGYDPTDVGLDSPGALETAKWLEDMAVAGHLKPDVDYDVLHTQFESGAVACIGTGPWALERIRTSGVNYTINPFPAGSAGPGKPFLGVQGFMVSAFSENQLLAQTVLMEVFATSEFMTGMYEADPRPAAYLPVREAIDDPDLASFAVAGADGLPMPAIPEMSSVWEAWTNALVLTISQQQSGEEAFMTAAEQIRTLISGQ
jgi:maltose/maltodextrin transport system substrate-binding protein/arabinogalactan oligomer/maltooligosaccharide transport system substrate-binding protein